MTASAASTEDVTGGHSVPLVRAYAWPIAVWAAMLVWSLALLLVVRDHFVNFRLARFDLGNMVQAVWSTSEGRPLDVTNGATGEQMSRLGGHVDPVLTLLAPMWAIAPTPLTLVAVQVVVVALGALPVFWLARRHLESERVAGLLALTYLAYPWVAWTAVDVFHPVTLAVSLLLYCVWFLDSHRLVAFAVCAILVLACGELMALAVAGLGLWYALARGRRRVGLAIAGIAAAWTFVALYVVVPAFSGAESVFYGAYEEVGGSPAGILETAVTDPLVIVQAVGTWHDVLYLFLLAVPLGGLFVLAPGLAAVALPQAGANVLAGFSATTDPRAHYVAAIIPFLVAATAIGLGRLSPTGRMRGAILALTLSAISSVMVGPWPGAVAGAPDFYRTDMSPQRLAALRQAVDLVPDDAPVASTNRIGSHLSEREYVASVPVIGAAEWVVMDMSDPWIPQTFGGGNDPAALAALRAELDASPEWEVVFVQGDVVVFGRVGR